MLKRDLKQYDFKIVNLHFVKSEQFSLTWSCGSRQRDTISNGWKFQPNNLAVKELSKSEIHEQYNFIRADLDDIWSPVM